MQIVSFFFFSIHVYIQTKSNIVYLKELNRVKASFLTIKPQTACKQSMEHIFEPFDIEGVRRPRQVYVHVEPTEETYEHTVVRDFIVRGEEWSAHDVVGGVEYKLMCPLDPNKAEDIKVLLNIHLI